MALDRRAFLSSTILAGPALLSTDALAAGGDQLGTLFDTIFQEDLRENPERASNLALDKAPMRTSVPSSVTFRPPVSRAARRCMEAVDIATT